MWALVYHIIKQVQDILIFRYLWRGWQSEYLCLWWCELYPKRWWVWILGSRNAWFDHSVLLIRIGELVLPNIYSNGSRFRSPFNFLEFILLLMDIHDFIANCIILHIRHFTSWSSSLYTSKKKYLWNSGQIIVFLHEEMMLLISSM